MGNEKKRFTEEDLKNDGANILFCYMINILRDLAYVCNMNINNVKEYLTKNYFIGDGEWKIIESFLEFNMEEGKKYQQIADMIDYLKSFDKK